MEKKKDLVKAVLPIHFQTLENLLAGSDFSMSPYAWDC